MQTTQELFGPAGLAFMKMAAHMNHVGQPIKLLYGVNGHGGEANGMASAPEREKEEERLTTTQNLRRCRLGKMRRRCELTMISWDCTTD